MIGRVPGQILRKEEGMRGVPQQRKEGGSSRRISSPKRRRSVVADTSYDRSSARLVGLQAGELLRGVGILPDLLVRKYKRR
jgi:hypothetical protein